MTSGSEPAPRDVGNLIERCRNVVRAGFPQARAMTIANVRSSGETDHLHAGGKPGLNATHAVLDDDAVRRLRVHSLRRQQEDIRIRLAALDHLGAEDVRAEAGRKVQNIKTD